MPRRKPVEAETAPVVPEVAQPKKTVRKAASKPKSATGSAAHKHHAKSIESAVETPVVQPAVTVTHEAIANLAYSFWEARGRQGGSSEQDWFRAESELLKLA
jgi:hypothetical protein